MDFKPDTHFTLYFYRKSDNFCGWVFDKTRIIYNMTAKELYRFLVHYTKNNFNPNLHSIYVCKNELLDFSSINVIPIFSFHIHNDGIFVENSKTRKSLRIKFYDNI